MYDAFEDIFSREWFEWLKKGFHVIALKTYRTDELISVLNTLENKRTAACLIWLVQRFGFGLWFMIANFLAIFLVFHLKLLLLQLTFRKALLQIRYVLFCRRDSILEKRDMILGYLGSSKIVNEIKDIFDVSQRI